MSQISTPSSIIQPTASNSVYKHDPLGVLILIIVSAGISCTVTFNVTLHHLDKIREQSEWAGVVVGGVQSLILFAQLVIFDRQKRAMERQTTFMNTQTDSIVRQGIVAHQDYIQTHRPMMRMRQVEMLKSIGPETSTDMKLWIKNVGSTNANVHLLKADIFLRPNTNRNYNAWNFRPITVPNSIITPGEALIVPLTDLLYINEIMWQHIRKNYDVLFLIANIYYTDDNGTNHETNVIRRYDINARRFVRLLESDPHFEFEFED